MKRRKMEKSAKYKLTTGFSLIEMLVALAVFATMAALAWGGLDSIVRTRAELAHQEDDFRALMRSVTTLDRDLRQAVARPVRGNSGEALPAFVGTAERLEFTWLGFANTQAEQRSNLQRVAYALDGSVADGGRLERGSYPVLDRVAGTAVQTSLLRDHVSAFRLRYLDAQQRWVETWPEPNNSDATSQVLPRAVELRIDTADYGEITRVIELVADWPASAAGSSAATSSGVTP